MNREEEGYREILRDALASAGPEAVRMLEGDEVDPLVVLAALAAAGLLDEVTAGPVAGLRHTLLQAAASSPRTAEVLGAVDLDAARLEEATETPGDEADDRLDRQLNLCGLHEATPREHTAGLARFLDQQRGVLGVAPEVARGLRPLAESLLDDLDLPGTHPASALLEAVIEAEDLFESIEAHGFDREAFRQGIERARWRVRRLAWLAWCEAGDMAANDLQALLRRDRPRALAADDEPLPWAELAREGEEALVLLDAGERLQLGWTGPGEPPRSARLGDEELAEAEAPFPGARCWWLPEAPGAATLVLVFADRTWRLR